MRALVVANEDDGDPGVVGARLVERGYRLERAAREAPHRWSDLVGVDLVLLLGSDWSVYWPTVSESVSAEADLVRRAHAAGIPIFAVCFGAQVVSHALGGAVRPADVPEIGWYEIACEGERLHPGLSMGPWFQWHVDRFDVPPGFVQLAQSVAGPQAMVAGRTLAVQFHPEVTGEIVERWCASGVDELARVGLDPVEVLDATRQQISQSEAAARDLVDWFVDTLGGGT